MNKKYLLSIFILIILFSSCGNTEKNIKGSPFSLNKNYYEEWIDKALEFNKNTLNRLENFEGLKNKMKIVKFHSIYLDNKVNAINFTTCVTLNNNSYFMEFQINDYGNLVLPISIYEETTLDLEERPELLLFSKEVGALDFKYLTSKLEIRENTDNYVFKYLEHSILTKDNFRDNGILFTNGKYLNSTEFNALDKSISVMTFYLHGSMNIIKNGISIYIEYINE